MKKAPADLDDKKNEDPKPIKSIMPLNKILGSKKNETDKHANQSSLKGEQRNQKPKDPVDKHNIEANKIIVLKADQQKLKQSSETNQD